MLPLRRLIWNNYKLIQRTRFEDFRGGMLWLGKKNHYVKSHASNFTCVNRSSSRKSFKQPPIAHVLWVSMTFSLSDRLWCNRRLCPIKGPYMVNSNKNKSSGRSPVTGLYWNLCIWYVGLTFSCIFPSSCALNCKMVCYYVFGFLLLLRSFFKRKK